jgi:hypothetical protein
MFIAELLLAVKIALLEFVTFSWLFAMVIFMTDALNKKLADEPELVIAACCPVIFIVDEVAVNDFVFARVLLFPEKVAVVEVIVHIPLLVNVL